MRKQQKTRTLSLRRALNFLRQSTVSCLCTTEATRSLCCSSVKEFPHVMIINMYQGRCREEEEKKNSINQTLVAIFLCVHDATGRARKKNETLTQIHGCFKASDAVILLYGLTVNI